MALSPDQLYELYAYSCAPVTTDSFLEDPDIEPEDFDAEMLLDEVNVMKGITEGFSAFSAALESSQEDPAALLALASYAKRMEKLSRVLGKIAVGVCKSEGVTDGASAEVLARHKEEAVPLSDGMKCWAQTLGTVSWKAPVSLKKSEGGKRVTMQQGCNDATSSNKVRKGTGFVRLTPQELGIDSDSSSD